MTFESIFKTIHGYDPFPWQSEAARMLSQGQKLSSVNVPTASGKTAMIDASLYAAAHGGPKRIVFIIDRRVVVDEAYDRVIKIQEALKKDPSLSDFSKKLGEIQVVRLRGGVHGHDDWVLYPEKVTVVISTVDQVGSRLLHRGYGVSARMAPVHAGFFGNESVYIVDEAHLSNPFIETVSCACKYGADIRLITMSATPLFDHHETEVVSLSSEDRSNPVLKRRINASKSAMLEETSNKDSDFVKRAVSAAQELVDNGRIIGVIVNRVNTARKIHKELLKSKKRSELLTGRIRPYDRDKLMERVFPEIRSGRTREEGPPLFIVATQTVEVGADIDFDAIVTEAASLDALRQRFGRLDRLGELKETKGFILYRPKRDKNNIPAPDPIYGTKIHEDWKLLLDNAEEGSIDFGIEAMESLLANNETASTEIEKASMLLPVHIGLLSQTGHDAPFLDISSWLHGTKSSVADVSVVWRSDLKATETDLWVDILNARPPLTREAINIPIYAVRAWLEERQEQKITDLEGTNVSSGDARYSNKPVLCWRGSDDCHVITSRSIRPGDTIVVPSGYGGCNVYGWNPGNNNAVKDIADFCSLERGKHHVVRLYSGFMDWIGDSKPEIFEAVEELIAAENQIDPEEGVDQERVKDAHDSLRALLSEIEHPLVQSFQSSYSIEQYPKGLLLTGYIDGEANTRLNTGKKIKLEDHNEGVFKIANNITAGHPCKDKITHAAKRHDDGKAESRFQVMLHGNPILAASGPSLAKSGMRTRAQMKASYGQSDMPKGFRHELASVGYLDGEDPFLDNDILVKYLISTHHGFGRPWFPYCEDSNAPGVEFSETQPKAFSGLLVKYGPWYLAGMELLIRASDARQSISEQL